MGIIAPAVYKVENGSMSGDEGPAAPVTTVNKPIGEEKGEHTQADTSKYAGQEQSVVLPTERLLALGPLELDLGYTFRDFVKAIADSGRYDKIENPMNATGHRYSHFLPSVPRGCSCPRRIRRHLGNSYYVSTAK